MGADRPPPAVGADRVVNAVAAYAKYGGPLVVVDLGTATTFDAVSAEGEYLGGAIAPGIGISAEALFQRAARLSRGQSPAPGDLPGPAATSASSTREAADTTWNLIRDQEGYRQNRRRAEADSSMPRQLYMNWRRVRAMA